MFFRHIAKLIKIKNMNKLKIKIKMKIKSNEVTRAEVITESHYWIGI